MVIINFDVQGCPQSSSDKRVERIRKRRNQGIHISALDSVLRNAQSANIDYDIDINNKLSQINYSHVYNRTKNFFLSSYCRLKDIGKYINGQGDYCAHCREYQHIFNNHNNSTEHNKDSTGNSAVKTHFSDTFVEKVQSQSKAETTMPACACCAKCKRKPKPANRTPVEFYCACEDASRRAYNPPYRRPHAYPYRSYPPPKPKRKQKKWWGGSKNKNSDTDWQSCSCNCPHHQERMNRRQMYDPYGGPGAGAGTGHPCMCPQNASMLQKFKYYLNGNAGQPHDNDMYNDYMDEMNPQPGGYPPYWHSKGYPSRYGPQAMRPDPMMMMNDQDDSDMYQRRPRTRHSSIEYMKVERSEDDFEISDSDDCCCCCPCRKDFCNGDAQTEEALNNFPKTIDTQTDRRKGGDRKRKCCKCCRNACGLCKRENNQQHFDVGKPKKSKTKRKSKLSFDPMPKCQPCPPAYCYCGEPLCRRRMPMPSESPRSADSSQGKQSPRTTEKQKHTIICKSAGIQHSPSDTIPTVDNSVSNSLEEIPLSKPSNQMQNIMFGHIKTTPLFLDKIFSSPVPAKSYRLPSSGLSKHYLPTNGQFLNTSFSHQASHHVNDDVISMTESTITNKTKKRFLNAVCDSILSDLAKKRRNSLSDILKSPDSGYQEPKSKKSLFAFKRSAHTSSNSKSQHLLSKYSVDSIESMVNTLKGSTKKKEGNVITEASKVVRGILEEISKNEETRNPSTLFTSTENIDELQGESLRNMLMNLGHGTDMAQSKSDSVLIDSDSLPGTSAGRHSIESMLPIISSGDSYTKLIKALDSLRSRNKVRDSSKS